MGTQEFTRQKQHSEGVIACLLTATDVAAIMGVSPKTVHKLVREGKLPCVQVTARERRFTPEQVQQYIESQSTDIRVDKKQTDRVSSRPKKGGENSKFVGVGGKDLRKEMKKWR
ncbi:MAG: helix-turn-helix domain-containing protein [Desulfomonilaceae bacterium]